MSHLDVKPDEKAFAIANGLRFFVADLNVNCTSGKWRLADVYYKADGSVTSISGELPGAGDVRLAIVEIPTDQDGPPVVTYGTAVTSPATPAYPATTANYQRIAKVGDTSDPIESGTTDIVEGSPGANEVQLINETSNYRL